MAWMRRSARAIPVIALVFCGTGFGRAESLEKRLTPLLADPQVKGAQVGIDIVEIGERGPVDLFAYHADIPLTTASCTKILTTAAAFETYGARATFKTQLWRVGDDLLLLGGGDPAFGDAKLCAAAGVPVTAVYDAWADALQKAGVTTFRDLVLDDRVFDHQFVHPNWPAGQGLGWYEAPIGGLNFNANCLDWIPQVTAQGVGALLIPPTSYVTVVNKARRGTTNNVWMWRPNDANRFELRGTIATSAREPESVTIVDPGMWAATILRDRLLAAGLRTTGTVKRIPDAGLGNQPAQMIAMAETPLLAVIKRANTNSLNMMAEGLCKRLGHDATGKPGSWENGTAAVVAYMQKLGVPGDLVKLDDGSGLSSKTHIAPRALTAALAHVAARPDGKLYLATLATPGDDGTLKNRFKGLPVAASIHAKTGHIQGASTLSGYIDAGGRRLVFSILVNDYTGNVNPWQDALCNSVWKWAQGQ